MKEPFPAASAGSPDSLLITRPSSHLMAKVRLLDACTISDALDAIGITGVVDGILPLWQGARAVGPAMTCALADGPPPPTASPVHLGARAIAATRPGDVIVVANQGRDTMGSWGGLLSLAASLRGVAGVVLDGACRDVDEARELGFAAFARRPALRTARGRVHEVGFGEPVSFCGVSVTPGDLVVADGSGVVFVPSDAIEAVVAAAEAIAAKEEAMRGRLYGGRPITEVLGTSYERMLDEV